MKKELILKAIAIFAGGIIVGGLLVARFGSPIELNPNTSDASLASCTDLERAYYKAQRAGNITLMQMYSGMLQSQNCPGWGGIFDRDNG